MPDTFNYVGVPDFVSLTNITHATSVQLKDVLAKFGYAAPLDVGIDAEDLRRVVRALIVNPPQLFDPSGDIERERAQRDVRNSRISRRERTFAFSQSAAQALHSLYAPQLLDALTATDRLLLLDILLQFLQKPVEKLSCPTVMSNIVANSLRYLRPDSGIDRIAREAERVVVDSLGRMSSSMQAAFVDDKYANDAALVYSQRWPSVEKRLLCVVALVPPSMRAIGIGADDDKGYSVCVHLDRHGICAFSCQCVAGIFLFFVRSIYSTRDVPTNASNLQGAADVNTLLRSCFTST